MHDAHPFVLSPLYHNGVVRTAMPCATQPAMLTSTILARAHVHCTCACRTVLKISDSCEVFHDHRGIARFTASAAIVERTIGQKNNCHFSLALRFGKGMFLHLLGARRPNLKRAQPKWPWIVIFFEGHHGQFEGQRRQWPSWPS